MNNFLVFKSSAGSGKTYTLVREYLTLVLEEPDKYRHILAITFTNKAADEMKQRVLATLKAIAELKHNADEKTRTLAIADELSATLNVSKAELSRRAGNVLTAILHNYSDFAIGTIDSFVHRIIKTFAHDLYLPMNFDVELDNDRLLEEAVDLLISKVGTNDELTKILVEFTESKTEDEKSWHIEDDIQKFASSLLKEEGQIYLDKLKDLSIQDFAGIIGRLQAFLSSFESRLSKPAADAVNLIRQNHIQNEAFYQGRSGIGKYFEAVANKNIEKIKPNSYVVKTIYEDKWHSGKATASDKSAIDNIKERLIKYYANIEKLIKEEFPEYVLQQQIRLNIYPIALLNELKKIIDEIKSENNILHISEFNKLISGIVLKEPVPFIYERTGEKFKHFLIDEFQDTSMLQWQNLLPLVDNSLAENNINVIAGDGKQAIYRWRNGEVEQFTSLPKIPFSHISSLIKEREDSLKRNYKEVGLDRNFRSRKNIVDFNNDFFKFIAGNIDEDFRSIYESVAQKSKDDSDGGYVQVEFLNNDGEEESFDEVYVKRIYDIIRQLQNDNFRLRDIAILCRSNSNASKTAQYLLSRDIDVVSSESLLLANSPVVNFIIACIQYIENTDNKIAEVQIVTHLINNGKITGCSLHEALSRLNYNAETKMNLQAFLKQNDFEFNIRSLVNMSVYDLGEAIVRIFKLNETQKVNPSLAFFINALHEFTGRKSNNLKDFLKWWEEKKDKLSIIVPEGTDAVRILTIHKSKGLQFPVVIYPFATEKLRNTKEWLWVDIDEPALPAMKAALLKNSKALLDTKYAGLYENESAKSYLDMINLLYVTMTRPEERIYVLTKKPGNSSASKESVQDIFCEYFKSRGEWNENNYIYNYGNTQKYIPSDKSSSDTTAQLDFFITNDWRKKIIVKSQALTGGKAESMEQQRAYGNLVHYILAKLRYADELENAMTIVESEGLIDKDEKNRIYNYLHKIISKKDVIKYFTFDEKTTVMTEAEIISKDGQIFRPDRLMINNNKITILEFKTGIEEDFHKRQVNHYAELLTDAGFEVVQKILLYFNEEDSTLIPL